MLFVGGGQKAITPGLQAVTTYYAGPQIAKVGITDPTAQLAMVAIATALEVIGKLLQASACICARGA